MAQLILDTGVLVEAERTGSLPPLPDGDDVAVAAVTLAELSTGALLAVEPRVAARRQVFVDRVRNAVTVLPYTAATAGVHAELLTHVRASGSPRGAHDLIIAAHARETGRTLISTDRRARFADLPGVTVAAGLG